MWRFVRDRTGAWEAPAVAMGLAQAVLTSALVWNSLSTGQHIYMKCMARDALRQQGIGVYIAMVVCISIQVSQRPTALQHAHHACWCA